jgi:carboxypeptidase Q
MRVTSTGVHMTRRIAEMLTVFLFAGVLLAADDNINADINWKIRREETEQSQVMRIVHYLTDVHGPRLTGSPNFKAACDWALSQMQEWGLQNAHLEEWDFGHSGWANERYVADVVSPFKDHLTCKVVAWTAGTKGRIRAHVVQIVPPENPSEEALTKFLDSSREKIRGKIVLVGAHKPVAISFNPPAKRLEDSEVRAQFDPANPSPRPAQAPEAPKGGPKTIEPRQMDERIDAFLLANGALVKATDAERDAGQVVVLGNRTYDASKVVPGLVFRSEDYGRITRVLADGGAVEMEVEIVNTTHPEGKTSYNVIGEIPGTDRKDEVVMLGGHLDSWHGGTGATDNATGVSAMMEAVRILQKLAVRPHRTIRIALWGGEEQGLLGSQAYVRDHFGTYEYPKEEFSKLVAYFNIDSGTGRVRGATIFGPPEAATVIREILKPFEDLGFVGAIASRSRTRGNTDSTSFNYAGLAGIGARQDPIEYFTHTWHTNLDTYDHVSESDMKQCAIIAAALVYHLAMMEEMLPRFTKDTMPEPGSEASRR